MRHMVQESDFLANMSEHLNDDVTPKVGIFWYNRGKQELFGVVKRDYDDVDLRPSHGLVTCKELHVNVWKRGFHRQKFKCNGVGPFIGDYKDKPRGRVFYCPTTGDFIIKVGSWIQEFPEAVSLIVKEFNLELDDYRVEVSSHWDIGSGWENL